MMDLVANNYSNGTPYQVEQERSDKETHLTNGFLNPTSRGGQGRRGKPRFDSRNLHHNTSVPIQVITRFSDIIGSDRITRSMMGNTQLVKLWRKVTGESAKFDIYIGRDSHQGGWSLSSSMYVNPYISNNRYGGESKDTLESLNNYRSYILGRDDLRNGLMGLYGKTLGCWCVDCTLEQDLPLPEQYTCHGQVLIEMMVILRLNGRL